MKMVTTEGVAEAYMGDGQREQRDGDEGRRKARRALRRPGDGPLAPMHDP